MIKEKIILISGILFVSLGIYMYGFNTEPQQYNYNGGIIKTVYAKVIPDSNSVLKTDDNTEWNKIDEVVVNLGSDSVSSPVINSVYIPIPPRDSH